MTKKKRVLYIDTNTAYNKYEAFNIVTDDRDSIYAPSIEELAPVEKGQVFISEEWVRKIIQEELDKRLSGDLQRDE